MQQREYNEVRVQLSGCSDLKGGSMNAAHDEFNCVNANIAIAQRWLGKCCANSVVCIPHVVAKMFFTNVEALGDA